MVDVEGKHLYIMLSVVGSCVAMLFLVMFKMFGLETFFAASPLIVTLGGAWLVATWIDKRREEEERVMKEEEAKKTATAGEPAKAAAVAKSVTASPTKASKKL
ncbi:unnamed protein product [Phaeothamnion confervicola]